MRKRIMPRHVDGRFKALRLRLSGLVVFIISFVIAVVILFNNLTVSNLLVLVLSVATIYLLLIELKHKETVLEELKSHIRHFIEGNRYYQRNTTQIEEHLRFIRRGENGQD